MKTWDNYKEHVKAVDPVMGKEIERTEEMTSIISAIAEQRKAPGLSQRELAVRCGIPQSSLARIETGQTIPNLRTLLNILQHLGLTLTVSPTRPTA